MTQTPSRSADDFLNFRMRLLAEIEDIESSIADVARERASIVAEASALDLELGKHSTTLAAAGVGTRRRSSLCGGGGGGPTASAQQEAAVVAAEMYASVDISAAGIADEEMLLRLLSARVRERKRRTGALVPRPPRLPQWTPRCSTLAPC